jgi:hypothetical protein
MRLSLQFPSADELRRDKIATPGYYFLLDTDWLMGDPSLKL